MSLPLSNPNFWADAVRNLGKLTNDGSLQYILLDKTFKMCPLIRDRKTTFTDFLLTDPAAKACKVIVNGNFYSVSRSTQIWGMLGAPDDPAETRIEGRIVRAGKPVAGDSRPQSFWFGQLAAPASDPSGWIYAAGKGDPPVGDWVLAAIGGVAPLIIGSLEYGSENKYRPGAPPAVSEPLSGEPPPSALPYMIQRSNATFKSASERGAESGKCVLAYCSAKRVVMAAVQKDGATPGQTHANLAFNLAQRGFDHAVFLDGSDSATLVVDGTVVIAPGKVKNDNIDVGIGFFS